MLLKVLISGYDDSTLFLKDTLQPYASIEGNAGAFQNISGTFSSHLRAEQAYTCCLDGSFNVMISQPVFSISESSPR